MTIVRREHRSHFTIVPFDGQERFKRRRKLTLGLDHQTQALQAVNALTFKVDQTLGAGHRASGRLCWGFAYMSDLEIILSTVGTDGDANPFIALGKELAKRRYTITIMTTADHEACAIANDIGFFAMNEPDWPQINRNDAIFFRESISYGYPRPLKLNWSKARSSS